MSKPTIVSFENYEPWDSEPMAAAFDVHKMPASGNPEDLPADVRSAVRAFAFKGHSAMSLSLIHI